MVSLVESMEERRALRSSLKSLSTRSIKPKRKKTMMRVSVVISILLL